MEIQNSTGDDAMIKVSGGSGIPIPPAPKAGNPPTQASWPLPRNQKVTLSSLPTGSVIHLYVEVSPQTMISDTVKGLKLTKNDNGYTIQVIKNDSVRRRRP